MPDLEPITREEMLLDGQDLEPITRKEMFIKRIYDKTQVIPEPITREEMFLKKAGDETTDVTIEQLSVSENGTYSEEGVAYSPVIVNVPVPPIPDNAYLLNEVEDLPKDIATFSDGADFPMPSLKVGIEPIQEGSGDPSPTNVRPISGHTEANVSVSGVNVWNEEWELGYLDGGNGQPTTEPTSIRSKNFNGCVPNTNYYGSIPTESAGSAYYIYWYDADKNYISRDNIGNATKMSPSSAIYFKLACYHYGTTYNNDISINYPSSDTSYHAYNGQTYTIDLDGTRYGGKLDVVSGVLTLTHGYIASYNGETLPSTWISDRDVYAEGTTPTIGAEVCYKLATPQTIQLTPTAVKSLLGQNNVWGDCGQITEGSYFSKSEEE